MTSAQTVTEFLANHEAARFGPAYGDRYANLRSAEARCTEDAEYERIVAAIAEVESAQISFINVVASKLTADGTSITDYRAVMAAAQAVSA